MVDAGYLILDDQTRAMSLSLVELLELHVGKVVNHRPTRLATAVVPDFK